MSDTIYVALGIRGGKLVTITSGLDKAGVLEAVLRLVDGYPNGEYTTLSLLEVFSRGDAFNVKALKYTPSPARGMLRELGHEGGVKVQL